MSSAPIKHLILLLLPLLAAGCNSSGSSDVAARADSLLSQARSSFDAANYSEALSLLDSIDRSCASAVDIRRQASLLRPQVMERFSAREMSRCDSLLLMSQVKGDSLMKFIRLVAPPSVEPYYVGIYTAANLNPRTSAGLHAHMSQDYHFYIIATSPRSVDAQTLMLSAAGDSVSTDIIPRDGERNTCTSVGDMLTLTEAESAPLAEFVSKHRDSEIALTFSGIDGNTVFYTLAPDQRDAIATMFELSRTIANDRYLRLEIQRLRQQLELSRQQTMNLVE